MTNMRVILSIENRSKAIPYPPEKRNDSENHGFNILKGKIQAIERIPEAMDNQAIASLLKSLNENESPFFSVGCEKSFNSSPEGFWAKGYIEFSFNYKELVSDASRYFPLFFHFNRHVEEYIKSNEVQFLWELQPALFKDAEISGFTACIWISTGYTATAATAKTLWESAVKALEDYLSTVGAPSKGSQIYASAP